jgi:ABC-type multidrug transport system fused ATPase/permease subunit
MDRGKVVETGTHDQLVAENGIYTGLWNLQTGQKD